MALAGLLALGGPSYVAAQQAPASDNLRGPGSLVPYVAQGPLLCGGASAAMIERFWGALGVYGEDYAHLVDPEAGGIYTDDLAAAMSRRGYAVEVIRGDPAAALFEVRTDLPVMALLSSGRARYHYVVVVAAGGGRVRFHDPLLGPDRILPRTEFIRRWASSDYWTLKALPAADDRAGMPEDAAGTLQRRDEAVTAGDLPPPLLAALRDLQARRPGPAVESLEAWLRESDAGEGHRDLAWEMLATARYMARDETGALAAWNRIGEPPVDLVRVHGLEHMRYPTAAEPLGLEPRETLTPGKLQLAERRLLQLPAVRLGRVGYQPLRDGSVEVGAVVLERRRFPVHPVELAGIGLGALINRRAVVELGPLLPVGGRWRLTAGFEDARDLAEVAVDVPWTPLSALATLRGGWTEERFVGDTAAKRAWGVATVRRWVNARARLGLSLGMERWAERDRLGRLGASTLLALLDHGFLLGGAVDAWAGDDRAARIRVASRLRYRPSTIRAWSLTVGGSLASRGAPPTLWDGAGTGRIRAPLLRGHALARDHQIGRDAFGRGLLHGSLGHAWMASLGPGFAALELFVDGARVWDPLAGDGPRSYLDPGAELRLSSGERVLAVSLARGDGDWVLSARVTGDGLPWLSLP